MHRKTIMILALTICLVAALLVIVTDPASRERLGHIYWIVGLSIVGCVALVLTGYVWDRSLVERLKTLQDVAEKQHIEAPGDDTDQDEIIGLARNIERLAQSLQKIEASYRGIVEDQMDLICRYRGDGKLTFVNGAYARFYGQKRQDLIGQPFPLFHLGLASHRGADGVAAETTSYEAAAKPAEGHEAWFSWTQRIIRSDDGEVFEYQSVGHDITIRREAEAALRIAKEAAESADRAKSDFLAMVSHEIRTPINAVLGFATLLRDSTLTADQAELVAMIRSGANTLEALINDILDLSKMEAGKLDIEHQDFALRKCIEDVCAFFAQKARSVPLSLKVEVEPDVPEIVCGDQARLRQILVNLVGNALKFTERGSIVVRVNCGRNEGTPGTLRLFFSVSDTGIGIPPEKLKHLFQPFSQVDTSATRRRGGTGLGLIISKRLCDLMGGAISVESRKEEGSTFRFSIVAGADDAGQSPPKKEIRTVGVKPVQH